MGLVVAFLKKRKSFILRGSRLGPYCWAIDYCESKLLGTLEQRDQMASLFFNIWPFTSMKTCPMTY